MTLPRTLASYASPKANARLLSNPRTDLGATEWNRLVADVAALTGPAPTKLRAIFSTVTSNGPAPPSWFSAQWGNDSASAPVITRTSAGVYTVTTPAAWASPGIWVYSLDPDEIVSTSEQVIWNWSKGAIDAAVSVADGQVRPGRSGYTLTFYITTTVGVLSDLGGAVPIFIEAG